jgi:hypothetical protein
MLKLWSTYSDAELRLLLRFADEGYRTMLEATEALKAAVETPAEKRTAVRKPPPRR